MNKQTFCALPFVEVFLGPDGGIKTCCSATHKLGSLHQQSVQEILNGEIAKDIRQHIIDDKWHPSCYQCRDLEQQGALSERQDNIELFRERVSSQPITSDFFKLKRLDLRWSNTCNLSCTYCYEYFSSKWAQIKGIKVNTIKDENEKSLFLLIEQNIDSIENVMLLGGEPLLQKQNHRLIDLLRDNNFYILTNLSDNLYDNKIAQKLLTETRHTGWGISFETLGTQFEYVRRGAKWEIFEKNIQYLISKNPVSIDAHSLYSVYSAFNLVEFYKFIVDNNFSHVYWNLLESTGQDKLLNILHYPDNIRHKAVEEIDRCEKMFPDAPGIDQLLVFKNQLLNPVKVNTAEQVLNKLYELEQPFGDTMKFKNIWPEIYKILKC